MIILFPSPLDPTLVFLLNLTVFGVVALFVLYGLIYGAYRVWESLSDELKKPGECPEEFCPQWFWRRPCKHEETAR
jgi:hypothetical protein